MSNTRPGTNRTGITSILTGNERPRLRHEWTAAFPDTGLVGDQPTITDQVDEVTADLRKSLDVILDIRGRAAERPSGRRYAAHPPARRAPMARLNDSPI